MEGVDDLKKLLSQTPGAIEVPAAPGSKAFLQTVRQQFRRQQRFDTVSRLIGISTDEVDRSVSADSLGYFGRRSTPFLVRALETDTAIVRRHAATALGLTGDPAAEPALQAALADPDPAVRFAAAQSIDLLPILSQVSSPDLVDLEEFQKDLEPEPREPGAKPAVVIDLEARNLFQELQRRANEYKHAGRFREAADCFGEIISIVPGLAATYVSRGTAYEQDKQYELALRDLNRSIELDPEIADAYQRRALCYRRLEKWDAALQDAIKAAELDPGNAQYWYNLGFFRQRGQEIDAAREAFDRAIELRPEYAVARFARGNLKLTQGDAAGAIEDLSAGLRLNPSHAGAWWNRSIAHGMLGNAEAMEQDRRRALELAPELEEQPPEGAP